jgi:hypothetical protein
VELKTEAGSMGAEVAVATPQTDPMTEAKDRPGGVHKCLKLRPFLVDFAPRYAKISAFFWVNPSVFNNLLAFRDLNLMKSIT